jgi:rRNA maturation protein Nop10
MNFFIRQHSKLPVLTVELIQDGVNSARSINEKLENAVILFFMEEIGSCIPMIQCGECCIVTNTDCPECNEKVYIQYKWQPNDTFKKGRYKGWFEITFNADESLLIVPIKDTLFINII